MPHSSGGGSHGGSSHGGSHGGSSAPPVASRHYYPGARTFYYYHNGAPVYVYSSYDLRTYRAPLLTTIIPLGFMALFIIVLLIVLFSTLADPSPLTNTSQYQILIEDQADVLDDTHRLELVLEDFKDQTGITPMILTINNERWIKYGSLEDYAYEYYVNKFDDETHWLIVYSEPGNPDPDFNDWYFEGMQGNDTDMILTESKTSEFNDTLYTNLLKHDNSVEDAFVLTFEKINPDIMTNTSSIGDIFPIFIAMGFMLFFAGSVVFSYVKNNSYSKKELFEVTPDNPDPTANPGSSTFTGFNDSNPAKSVTTKCPYCQKEYIKGAHKSCPHCGVFIPPEE